MLISLGQCYMEFTQWRTNWSFINGCPFKKLFAVPFKKAIEWAMILAIASKIFCWHVGDSHADLKVEIMLLNVLNSQDPQI